MNTSPTEIDPRTRPGATYSLRVSGTMPLSGVKVVLATDPAKLTREHLKGVQAQLAEALTAIGTFRVLDARLALTTVNGDTLRETALIEAPDGGYVVREVTPGGDSGTTGEWLTRTVIDYRRKKSVEA